MRLGVLPLCFFLFLVPLTTPVLEQYWPSASVWWSAILVAVLGAASSAIWLVYRKQLAKAGMPSPSATAIEGAPPGEGDYTTNTYMPKPQSAVRTWLLG